MKFIQNYDLTKLNTLRLRSSAKYFTNLTSITQLSELAEFIQEKKCSFIVIGSGSNILLPELYDGLVIHNDLFGVELIYRGATTVMVKAMAGYLWDSFVANCTISGWYGLENLSSIPGTVGAAPVQNIGAYGVEVGDFIQEIEVYNFATMSLETIKHKDCAFSYRNSMLKKQPKYMVVSVVFKLNRKPALNLSYPEVAKYMAIIKSHTPVNLRRCIIELRATKLPNPAIIHNVGSFFHNPIVSCETVEYLKSIYTELPIYKVDENHYKLSAGWLIDKLGLKGFQVDNMMVYEHHALILVNKGNATQKESLSFATIIQKKVLEKYNVQLNIEPIIIR